MKKLLLAAFVLAALSPFSFAQWGVGVKLGAGQNNPKDLQDCFDYNCLGASSMTLTTSSGIFAIEGLYEFVFNPEDERNKAGIKFGIDFYGENKLEAYGGGSSVTIKETTYSIPITAYYKRDNGINKFAFYGGAGFTIMKSTLEFSGLISAEESETKIFPHIVAGTEYRFSKLFALGLDLKYNISAKIEKDGDVLSDRSGLSGALAARFYF